jgi:zinc protease
MHYFRLRGGDGFPWCRAMQELQVPPVEVARLDNGLEILVQPDHASPVASLQLWVRSGSLHEGPHLGAGLSHLIEHLVFKGTRSYGPGEAALAVQAAGGYLNAYTSFERTVYLADMPAEGLAECLRVVGELVFRPLFPEEEFEREMEVIRREIAMGNDDPRDVLTHELLAAAYLEHPCRHPVIGRLGAFNRLSLADVRAHHAARYVPNNCFLVVAGAVAAADVLGLAEEQFGDLVAGPLPAAPAPLEPRQAGPRRRVVPFATDLARVSLAWHIPAQTHPDTPALDLLGRVLGQGRSSRLYRRLRDERGIAHSVGAGSYSPGFDGIFYLDGECEPEHRTGFEEAALAEIATLVRDGIGGDELEKVRKGVLAEFFGGLESSNGLAAATGASWLLTGSTDFPSRYVAGLGAVTTEKIRAAAAAYLRPDGLTVVHMVPRAAAADGPAGGSSRERPGVRELFLANGLRVLLGHDPRLPLLSLRAGFRGGAALDPAGKAGLASLLAAALWKGTARSSAAELAERIESRGGRCGASGGNNSLVAAVHTLAGDLPSACTTLAEVLHEAAFPDDAVARERAALLAAARETEQDPLRLAFRHARRLVFAGTCHAEPASGTVESLPGLGRDDLAAASGRMFQAANGTLALFGDFDPDLAAALLEKHFGTLEAGADAFAALPPPTGPATGAELDLTLPKEQATLVIAFPTGGIDDPDSDVHDLIDEACGDMASRLFLRIRERQGLAYYVAPFQAKGWQAGAFGFYLGTSADKLDHAAAELLDEAAQMAAGGLDPAELARAKRTWRGKFLLQNQGAGARGSRALVDALLGLGHDHAERQLAAIDALDATAVQAAAARLFARPPVLVRVRPAK